MDCIDKETKQKIITLIKALLPEAKIYLFGSRAKGTHDRWSDIDIAVDTGQPLPITAVDEAASVLEATNIPYKIELVDFRKAPAYLQKSIEQEGILWKN
jgi:uncharacterized protein